MARTNNLSNFLTDVADAIRTKKGSEELIAAEDFDTEIENLPSGGGADLSDYFRTTISPNDWGAYGGFIDSIKKLPSPLTAGTSLKYAFYYSNFSELPAILGIENVTNMSGMFSRSRMTNITLNYNSISVIDMSFMFNYATAQSIDLSHLITSNVTTMSYMFSDCSSLRNLNLGGTFDTSNVTDMSGMFYRCVNLTSLDLSNFTFTKVTSSSSYSEMFGSSASYGVPDNCLIYVKDQASKDWIESKFSRLTNVQIKPTE